MYNKNLNISVIEKYFSYQKIWKNEWTKFYKLILSYYFIKFFVYDVKILNILT